jgi:predicted nucleic acid-binding protein
VNVYLDTNIVVADAVAEHDHHESSAALFHEIQRRRWTPVISAHGIAEIYAVLTSVPFSCPVSPAEAWRVIQENVLSLFEIEALPRSDYTEVLRQCAAQGWTGGLVYDAIHLQAARKAKCARVYTFNLTHFRRIAPDLHDRIMRP